LVQRCVVHKLRNLEAHAPKRALDDLRAEYHAITQASSGRIAQDADRRFIRRWQPRSDAVVRSLEEAGDELLTVYRSRAVNGNVCAPPTSSNACMRNFDGA
jgi:putative transposase